MHRPHTCTGHEDIIISVHACDRGMYVYVCDPTTHVEEYPHSFIYKFVEAWSNVLILTMGFLI